MRAAKLATTVLLAAAVAVAIPSAATAIEELPVAKNFGPAVSQQLADPDSAPPGSNDWDCEPSAQHPNPVILAHGLLANKTVNWQTFAPLLHNDGYCVFALTYGMKDGVGLPFYQPGGMIRMEESAVQLADFVDQVLAATGAAKVDLLGHSEGTLMPSYYVRFLDGGAKVDKYVSLTPLWEGTTAFGLAALYTAGKPYGFTMPFDLLLDQVCPSCTQFLQGSDFLKTLHAKGVFDPDVSYTNIVTRYDQAVVPYTSGVAEGDNITNIVLQDSCPQDLSDHAAVGFSPNAAGHVLNALDPANATTPACTFVTPLGAM